MKGADARGAVALVGVAAVVAGGVAGEDGTAGFYELVVQPGRSWLPATSGACRCPPNTGEWCQARAGHLLSGAAMRSSSGTSPQVSVG